MSFNDMWDYLAEMIEVTDDFLEGATAIGGNNKETMLHCLFYQTGWSSFYGQSEEEAEICHWSDEHLASVRDIYHITEKD